MIVSSAFWVTHCQADEILNKARASVTVIWHAWLSSVSDRSERRCQDFPTSQTTCTFANFPVCPYDSENWQGDILERSEWAANFSVHFFFRFPLECEIS